MNLSNCLLSPDASTEMYRTPCLSLLGHGSEVQSDIADLWFTPHSRLGDNGSTPPVNSTQDPISDTTDLWFTPCSERSGVNGPKPPVNAERITPTKSTRGSFLKSTSDCTDSSLWTSPPTSVNSWAEGASVNISLFDSLTDSSQNCSALNRSFLEESLVSTEELGSVLQENKETTPEMKTRSQAQNLPKPDGPSQNTRSKSHAPIVPKEPL